MSAGRTENSPGPLGMDPVHRWEQRCRQAGDTTVWPASEALELLHGIRGYVLEDDDRRLRNASRRFALANHDVAILVRRVGCLRELFGEDGIHHVPDLNGRLQRCLDLVTAVATESATAALADAALTDTLTGVGNRRSLHETSDIALTQASRNKDPLSIAIIDLKGLKEINDTQGHAAGDRALTGFTASLRAVMRQDDRLFRVGGDEFVLLLPSASGDAVANVMSRAARFNAPAFSWGAATFPADGRDLDSLLELADSRLYKSREAEGYYRGRHRQEVDPVLATWLRVPAAPTALPTKRYEQPRRKGRAGLLVGGLAVLAAVLTATLAKPGLTKTILSPYAPSVTVTLEPNQQTKATTAARVPAGAKPASAGGAATNLPALSNGGSGSNNAGSAQSPATVPSSQNPNSTTSPTPTTGRNTGASPSRPGQGQPQGGNTTGSKGNGPGGGRDAGGGLGQGSSAGQVSAKSAGTSLASGVGAGSGVGQPKGGR